MLPDFLYDYKKPIAAAAVIVVVVAVYLMSQRPAEAAGAPGAYPSSVNIPEGSTGTALPNDDSGSYLDSPPPVQPDPT